MVDDKSTTVSPKEQIAILLKEYDTLRAELIARTNGAYQFIGVGALLFTALLAWVSAHAIDLRFWIAAGIFVTTILIFVYMFVRDVNGISSRIAEIESRVNSLAGATLLEWESRYGGRVTGWVIRRKPRPPLE